MLTILDTQSSKIFDIYDPAHRQPRSHSTVVLNTFENEDLNLLVLRKYAIVLVFFAVAQF
jgi:hypothetical protein